MTQTVERIDGVVIGVFLGFAQDAPLVAFPGSPEHTAIPARSLADMSAVQVGEEVALLFQEGDASRPVIVGRMFEPAHGMTPTQVVRDGEHVKIVAEKRLELRCGRATIIMEKDGRIAVRGTYLTSHASAANRILGGSINLN
jgi:hypothetical protein